MWSAVVRSGRQAAIVILANLHPRAHEVWAQRRGRDLQLQSTTLYRVSRSTLALHLDAEDFRKINARHRDKRRAFLLRRHCKPCIVRRKVDVVIAGQEREQGIRTWNFLDIEVVGCAARG